MPTLLLLMAAPAALLWGLVFLRYGGLLPACLATLAVGICLGSEFFQVSLLTLDRGLWAMTILAYLLFRWQGKTVTRLPGAADLWVLAFVGWLCFSTLTHDWRWHEKTPLSRLIFYYLYPLTMYWVAREIPLRPSMLRKLYIALGVFGVYLGGTAVAEVTQLYGLVFPRYITSEAYVEFLGRGRGPLLNPSGNGVLLSTCLFAACLVWPARSRIGMAATTSAAAIIGAGVAATLTRCVWMGAALGTFLIAYLRLPARWRTRFVVASCVTVALGLVVSWNNLTAFKRDKNVSVSDMKKSAGLRPILAYVAWEMFQDRPWFGVGFGHYKRFDKYYLGDRSTSLVLEHVRPYHQHNVFLSLLTETGLVGMAAYTVMGCLWCRTAWLLWRSRAPDEQERKLGLLFLAMIAAYLANGMFQDVTIIPMIHCVVFFFAGLMVGVHRTHHADETWQRLITALGPASRIATRPAAATRSSSYPASRPVP